MGSSLASTACACDVLNVCKLAGHLPRNWQHFTKTVPELGIYYADVCSVCVRGCVCGFGLTTLKTFVGSL